jgi:ribonuclease Z
MKRLIVLGTGQAVCIHHHNTCFALDNGEEYFLIDGGGGSDILSSFYETGIEWQKLHYAFLSHQHTDHLLGMVWVVRYVAELINWHKYEGDFTLYTHDVAAEKLLAICEMLLKPAQFCLIGKRIHVELVEDGQTLSILGSRFTFFDIHSTKAKQFGFRMETPSGHHLVFLGDEPFSEECSKYMEPCDWLLSEAYCLYSEREIYNPYELYHSTVRETCLCAERFHAKNLVIWHTEDETTYGHRRETYTAEGSQFYSGKLHVPEDYDVLQLENQTENDK